MAVLSPTVRDRDRLAKLIDREQERLDASTPSSARMYWRAHAVLVGGVASSFQRRKPWPFYLARGQGSSVWDIDGRRMIDFHHLLPASAKPPTKRKWPCS